LEDFGVEGDGHDGFLGLGWVTGLVDPPKSPLRRGTLRFSCPPFLRGLGGSIT
jgi:hypothetical protein